MGKSIRASVLILALTGSAQAGWIQNDVKQQSTDATQTATADGEMPNGGSEGFTETVLSLLESVLSLL